MLSLGHACYSFEKISSIYYKRFGYRVILIHCCVLYRGNKYDKDENIKLVFNAKILRKSSVKVTASSLVPQTSHAITSTVPIIAQSLRVRLISLTLHYIRVVSKLNFNNTFFLSKYLIQS